MQETRAVSQVYLKQNCRYSSDRFLVRSYDTSRHARHLDKYMRCGFLFGRTEVASIVLTLLRMENTVYLKAVLKASRGEVCFSVLLICRRHQHKLC